MGSIAWSWLAHKGDLTHDISGDLTGKCLFLREQDAGRLLAAVRAVGCVLDVFSGVSRLALAARCPFLAVDERSRYMGVKEHEIDDLCGRGVPKRYIFSFATIIDGGNPEAWDYNIVNTLLTELGTFVPALDRETWPPTGEVDEPVSYDGVRRRNARRYGVKFLKIARY